MRELESASEQSEVEGKRAYFESSRKGLMLCMVRRAVEEGEIMMIGFNCFFFEEATAD